MGVKITPIVAATPRLLFRSGVALPSGACALRETISLTGAAIPEIAILHQPERLLRDEMYSLLHHPDERVALTCLDDACIGSFYPYEIHVLIDAALNRAARERALWTPVLDTLCDGSNYPQLERLHRMRARPDQLDAIYSRLDRVGSWVRRQRAWQNLLPLTGFRAPHIRFAILQSQRRLPTEMAAHLVGSDVSLLVSLPHATFVTTENVMWALHTFAQHAADLGWSRRYEIHAFLTCCLRVLPPTLDALLVFADAMDRVPESVPIGSLDSVRTNVAEAFRKWAQRGAVNRDAVKSLMTSKSATFRELGLELLPAV